MTATEAGFSTADAGGSLALYGATLNVQVGFDEKFDPGAGGTPNLPAHRWPALVDTGARVSCISSELAIRLGLPVITTGMIAGVHGTTAVNLHQAQIHVPELGFTLDGRFYGVNLFAGQRLQSVLIGRDFLRHFKMVYDGRTGAVTISDE